MTVLAWVMAVVLWGIAALHSYWGAGGVWPGTDALSLARTVVGARGIKRMPSTSACLLVAAVLVGLGHVALELAGVVPILLPEPLLTLVAAGSAIVFLGRGFAAYLPSWRRLVPDEPFASLDRRLFGPLCLALGFGFVVLVLKGVF